MKRMVYIIFAITTLVVLGAFATGCSNTANKEKTDFVGISLSQNHMDFTYCYSFYLREEDGKAIFDAQFRSYDEPYEIVLESCEVDNSYIKELYKIEQKYSIVDYVESYKKKKLPFQVMDETVNQTSVYYNDSDVKTADTSSEYKDELYSFFVELTKEYQSCSVTE